MNQMAGEKKMRGSGRLGAITRHLGFQIVAASLGGLLAGAALAFGPYQISQKNRKFQPGQIAINRGETLRFINDDGELLHHAYLKSPSFQFDSGDQKPGSKFEVVFPVAGNFTVLCAIHPKMKLVVDVK
jgi:plastocyanin